jgi:D-amino peptidase
MTGNMSYLKINDQYASEFMVSAYTAGYVGVPVVFLSGDAALCEEAQKLVPGLSAVAVLQGVGDSTVSIHPHLAVDRIRAGVEAALKANVAECRVPLPEQFAVEVRYKDHARAYRASFFPGVRSAGPHAVQFHADDWFEVLRFFEFCIS